MNGGRLQLVLNRGITINVDKGEHGHIYFNNLFLRLLLLLVDICLLMKQLFHQGE